MTVICDKCGKPFLVRRPVNAETIAGLRCSHCGAPQWVGEAQNREELRRRLAKLPRGVS